ncbi:unnamed protein product [Brassicogethes aeneus]|uniref:Uncharacterized protein n=1 Tax=Brassicogethes aeneus TaxID=1431903 RepID=A0A9P0BGG6_BRAAE|nr:unnamed protein product [Brassicogethes aeneus]
MVVAMHGSGSAGPTRSSISNCTAPGANQPRIQVKNTAKTTGDRKDSVDSIDLVWDEETQTSVPRTATPAFHKVFGAIPRSYSFSGTRKRKESTEVYVIREAIEEITRLSMELERNVEQNTKRKMKNLAETLKEQVEILNRVIIRDWLNKHRYEDAQKIIFDGESQTEENVGSYAQKKRTEEQETQTEAEAPSGTTGQQESRQLMLQCVSIKQKMPEGTARGFWTTAQAFSKEYPGGEIPKPGQVVAVKQKVTSSVGDKSVGETTTTSWLLMQEEKGSEPLISRCARQACLVRLAEMLRSEGTCRVSLRMIQGVPLEKELMEAIGQVKLEVILLGEARQGTWSDVVKGTGAKEGPPSEQGQRKQKRTGKKSKPGMVTIGTRDRGYNETLREVRSGGEACELGPSGTLEEVAEGAECTQTLFKSVNSYIKKIFKRSSGQAASAFPPTVSVANLVSYACATIGNIKVKTTGNKSITARPIHKIEISRINPAEFESSETVKNSVLARINPATIGFEMSKIYKSKNNRMILISKLLDLPEWSALKLKASSFKKKLPRLSIFGVPSTLTSEELARSII